MSALDLKTRVGPLTCMLHCLHAMDYSESPLVQHLLDLLAASMHFSVVELLNCAVEPQICRGEGDRRYHSAGYPVEFSLNYTKLANFGNKDLCTEE